MLRFCFLLFTLNTIVAQSSFKDSIGLGKQFELHCEFTGRTGKKIFLNYLNSENKNVTDSATINNGKCVFMGRIDSPLHAFISNGRRFRLDGQNTAHLFIGPGVTKITLDYYDFNKLKAFNSKTHEEYLALLKAKANIPQQLDSLYMRRAALYNAVATTSDLKIKASLAEEIQIQDLVIDRYSNEEIEREFTFIRQHPDSYVALERLQYRLSGRESVGLMGEIATRYDSLSPEVRQSRDGIQIGQAIKNREGAEVGSMAPDFAGFDFIKKETVTLSAYRNKKYILLDFWASWCAPCVADFQFLKEANLKYGNDNFEIIALSKDEDRHAMENAIKRYKIEKWTQLSLKETPLKIAEIYAVPTIPVKILIDLEGKIIGRWRGGGAENKKELEALLTQLLSK